MAQQSSVNASSTKSTPELKELSWLAGVWAGTTDGETVEEHWMEPGGGMMVGMNRTLYANGKSSFEYLRLDSDKETIVFYASPSGKPATPFPLKEIDEKKAVFENLKSDFPQRIIYQRKDNTLHASIEGEVGGKRQTMKWVWTLKSAQPR